MKHLFSCVVLCLIVIMLLFGIEVTTRCKETETKLQIVEYEKEQEIEELRKEIRLLKTDISIMQTGFENERSAETKKKFPGEKSLERF